MKINELNLDGYKHIKNNEWDYPNNLLDYLFEHGFKRQGKGHFSEVWASDSEDFVVKINMGKYYDENYLKFVDYCYQNKGNPHLPKMGQIKQMKTPDGKNFYILFIEKLKPVTPEMLQLKSNYDYYYFMIGLIDYCKNKTQNEIEEIVEQTCENMGMYHRYVEDYIKFVKIYSDMIEKVGMDNMDIELKNIMQRNDGTLVITDPVF